MTHRNEKTKNQSGREWLESVIREWFLADLRRKIYPFRDDRKYWERVADGKKKKIIDFCGRNQLPSIFDNPKLKHDYYRKYFPKGEISPLLENDADIKYYYRKNTDVIVEIEEQDLFGKIEFTDFDREVTHIVMNDRTETHLLSNVRRVL